MIAEMLYATLGAVVIGAVNLMWFESMANFKEDMLLWDLFEHYHWGLLSLLLVTQITGVFHWILLGVGLYLIGDEFLHNHPFAIGSHHALHSTLIGLILVFLVVYYGFIYGEPDSLLIFQKSFIGI